MADRWIEETFHPHWRVGLKAEKILFEEKSAHQDVVIFDNATWGRVLMLDGVVQLSTADDFAYHEMMAHVPLMAHPNPERVLIIGGGDGGVLREVVKHACVKEVVLVEIDRTVIDTALEYFPTISDGAFDDARTQVVIADGLEYVAQHKKAFDAIIVDSSEPIGPSAVLHSKAFFADCRAALTKGGVLVSQNGLAFLFPDHLAGTTRVFQSLFKRVAPYLCHQPCYFGGPFAINLASDTKAIVGVDGKELRKRAKKRGVSPLKYWTPDAHLGAFALPAYMADVVKAAKQDAKAGDDSGYVMGADLANTARAGAGLATAKVTSGASATRKTASQKATARKTPAQKATATKATAKTAAAKTAPAKKAPAKKAPDKTAPARKKPAPAASSAATSAAKTPSAKTASTKAASTKTASTKTASAKSAAAKKTASKTPVKSTFSN